MTVNNSMVYHCMIQREGLLSRPRKIGIEGEFKDYILQCFFWSCYHFIVHDQDRFC